MEERQHLLNRRVFYITREHLHKNATAIANLLSEGVSVSSSVEGFRGVLDVFDEAGELGGAQPKLRYILRASLRYLHDVLDYVEFGLQAFLFGFKLLQLGVRHNNGK